MVNTCNSFSINNMQVNIISIIGLNRRILRGSVQGVGMCARPGAGAHEDTPCPESWLRWDDVLVLHSSSIGQCMVEM